MTEQLQQHGFKEIQPVPFDSESVKKRYQRKYENNKGVKYFIDVKYYEIPNVPPSYSFQMWTQLKGGEDMHIQCEHAKSISDVELYFERIWSALGRNYYSEIN